MDPTVSELESGAETGPAVATLETDVVVADHDIEDELLVEEISIDGMCGVY